MYREFCIIGRYDKDVSWFVENYSEAELKAIVRFFDDYLAHGGDKIEADEFAILEYDENNPEDREYLEDCGIL